MPDCPACGHPEHGLPCTHPVEQHTERGVRHDPCRCTTLTTPGDTP